MLSHTYCTAHTWTWSKNRNMLGVQQLDDKVSVFCPSHLGTPKPNLPVGASLLRCRAVLHSFTHSCKSGLKQTMAYTACLIHVTQEPLLTQETQKSTGPRCLTTSAGTPSASMCCCFKTQVFGRSRLPEGIKAVMKNRQSSELQT